MSRAASPIFGRLAGFTVILIGLSLLDFSSVSPASAGMSSGCASCVHRPPKGESFKPPKHDGGRRRDRGRRTPGIPGIGGVIITIPTQPIDPGPEFDEPPPQRVAECGPGEVFSRNRGACVCRKGFTRSHGGCVPAKRIPPPVKVVECGQGEFFSKSRKACVCRKGLVRLGDGCGKPVVIVEKPKKKKPPVIVVEEPKAPPPPKVVKKQPKPEPVAEPAAAPATVRQVQRLATLPEKRACLPPDLYDLLKETYGRDPAVDRCEAACLAKPANFSEDQLADMTRRFGVVWCNDCIKLGGWLPLSDIERLEKLTGATFCMTGGASFCSAPGYARVDPLVTKVKVIETIRQLPATLGKDGDIAVVIGNETYADGIPANTTGSSDADAVLTLLTDKLGYKKQNVIDLRNATLADMQRVFGGADGIPGELGKLYNGEGDVFIYVSSHGLRDEASGKSYLLPVDAKDSDLAGTAYALDDLYAHLGIVGARTIMLALETSFPTSLSTLIDPPNLPEAESAVLPDKPVPGLAVFTASDRDQRPLDDPEFGIGLFTRYLIEGMAGKADAGPTGNDDKRLDSVELYVFTANMVRTAARKSLGLEQKPQLSKVDNLLIGKLAGR